MSSRKILNHMHGLLSKLENPPLGGGEGERAEGGNSRPVVRGYYEAPSIRGAEIVKQPVLPKRCKPQKPDSAEKRGGVLSELETTIQQLGKVSLQLSELLKSAGPELAAAPEPATEPLENEEERFPCPSNRASKPVNPFLPRAAESAPRKLGPIPRTLEMHGFKPEITRGRLYFSCPACRYPTAVYPKVAGKEIRCPRCYSAIRAPDPKRGRKARNLENDIQSLLHPERFQVVVPPSGRRLLPGIPLPAETPTMRVAGFALLLVALFSILNLSVRNIALQPPPAPASQKLMFAASNMRATGGDTLRERAAEVVVRFFQASDCADKARYVCGGDQLIDTIRAFHEDHPEYNISRPLSLTTSGVGYYGNAEARHPVTEVAVQLQNYEYGVFTVEHLPEGDLIEWESSVGYNPVPLRAAGVATAERAGDEMQLRVLASLDDYYNFDFGDRSAFLCVRLQDPRDQAVAYGYIRKTNPDAKEIDFLLAEASPKAPQRLIVEMRQGPRTAETRQFEITRLVEPGWRLPTNSLLSLTSQNARSSAALQSL